jgi:hypothetical protein
MIKSGKKRSVKLWWCFGKQFLLDQLPSDDSGFLDTFWSTAKIFLEILNFQWLVPLEYCSTTTSDVPTHKVNTSSGILQFGKPCRFQNSCILKSEHKKLTRSVYYMVLLMAIPRTELGKPTILIIALSWNEWSSIFRPYIRASLCSRWR